MDLGKFLLLGEFSPICLNGISGILFNIFNDEMCEKNNSGLIF